MGVFFVDLLSRQQRKATDDNWTGAEVRACCRLAALLDIPLTAAAQNVVPVAVTAAESVERLRKWASGRCLNAAQTGVYGHVSRRTGRRRRTDIEPSEN